MSLVGVGTRGAAVQASGMGWKPLFLVFALFLLFLHSEARVYHYTDHDLDELRSKVKEMFFHGFNAYMENAYPADELKPLSCKPRERQNGENSAADGVDLVLGRYQLTLVDSLDTLYIMGEKKLWKESIERVISTITFDSDLDVSVFETNIRIVGSLLSNYLFALDEQMYEEANELLHLAVEMADRLIPAFLTPTGIPYSKVNLRTGSTMGQTLDTCTACAGTYILEFGLLSKLTGNSLYLEAAHGALMALDNSSSKIAFMGAQISVEDGTWSYGASGIGAGIDSLYEYLIKAYILFGDEYYFQFFSDIYQRAMASTLVENWYIQTNIQTAAVVATWTDALGAFWPGMQVLAGDLAHAKTGFQKYWSIWKKYGVGLPERFDVTSKKPTLAHHSLRPELIESAYMLYTATQDPFYIYAGAEMMKSYDRYCKVPCGYANMLNVDTKELEDKMESFFLSETLKYLYLLFTPNHPINQGNYIFTTEAHPIKVETSWQNRDNKRLDLINGTCTAPMACQLNFSLTDACPLPNSLYRRETRRFGGKAHYLHYIINGLKHEDIKNVGAHILPSDRQIIVSASGAGLTDSDAHFYSIKAAFGGIVTNPTEPLELALADPPEACTALLNAEALAGKVVLAYRGGCTFAEKAESIESAGAMAIVFVNHLDHSIFTMSDDKWHPSPVKIPLVLISKEDGAFLHSMLQPTSEIPNEASNEAPNIAPNDANNNANSTPTQKAPTIRLSPAHPDSEFGVLQFVLQLHPTVPETRWPPIGKMGEHTAYKYGDSLVLMSKDQDDHIFRKDWESSNFQVYVGNETAPFRIMRALP